MALNAMDGMMAREYGQQTLFGCYLNELADIVSDAFLYLPFAQLPEFWPPFVLLFIFLAALAETAGILGVLAGASRRYDGPLGKSDRAALLGLISSVSPEISCIEIYKKCSGRTGKTGQKFTKAKMWMNIFTAVVVCGGNYIPIYMVYLHLFLKFNYLFFQNFPFQRNRFLGSLSFIMYAMTPMPIPATMPENSRTG